MEQPFERKIREFRESKKEEGNLKDNEKELILNAFKRAYGLQDSFNLKGNAKKQDVVTALAQQTGLRNKFIEDNFEEIQKLPKQEYKKPEKDKPNLTKEEIGSANLIHRSNVIKEKYNLTKEESNDFLAIGARIAWSQAKKEGNNVAPNISKETYDSLVNKGLLHKDGDKYGLTPLGKKERDWRENVSETELESQSPDKPEAKKEEEGKGKTFSFNEIQDKYKLSHEGMYRFVSIGNWIDDEGVATPLNVESDIYIKKLEESGLLKVDGKKVYFTNLGKKEFNSLEDVADNKPVNERSNQEIGEAKQKIADTMPKPINKMTWEEFKPYGIEMQKQSSYGQPESHYERLAKMEHDWAIKQIENYQSNISPESKKQDNYKGFSNNSLPKDKPFKIEFEQFHTGSGKRDEATVTYDKKNFIYDIESKNGTKTKMGEKKLQEMIDNGDYKIAKESNNINQAISDLSKVTTRKELGQLVIKQAKSGIDSLNKEYDKAVKEAGERILSKEKKDKADNPFSQALTGANNNTPANISKVFSNKFHQSINQNHGGLNISAEAKDGYWINAMQNKKGEFDVMIGQKGKDIDNTGVSMNMFYNKTMSREELNKIDFQDIINKDSIKQKEIRKRLEAKHK
jgi:hypothetical protein